MRKYSILFVAGFVLSLASMLSSCKKSHETPAKPKLSFSQPTKTVKESDGSIDITMTLDKPAPEAIDVTYELGGTAKDKVSAGTTSAFDYEITTSYLETKIKKGESSGTITVKLYSDFSLEDDEIIEISIKSTDSDNIEITRDDQIKITVTQEDGLFVLLEWGQGAGEHYTDVDMDLFLWAESNSTLGLTNVLSAGATHDSPEFFFTPTALLDDGNYGLSCNYYEGTVDSMNFEVSFIKLTDGNPGTAVTRKATYTLANINPWYTSGNDPLLVETFKKSGTDFTDFSQITVPDTMSRVSSRSAILSTLKKEDRETGSIPRLIIPYLNKK